MISWRYVTCIPLSPLDPMLTLLKAMLVYDPAGRISAKQACHHDYFMEDGQNYNGKPASRYPR